MMNPFTSDDLPPTRTKYITIRTTNTDDRKDHFKQCFHNKHDFDQLDTNIHIPDPNHNYEILEQALKETHSAFFPERRVKFNDKKQMAYYDPLILENITMKTNFNKYRNTLNKTITNAKRVYYKEIFNLYKHDMKKTLGCYLRNFE